MGEIFKCDFCNKEIKRGWKIPNSLMEVFSNHSEERRFQDKIFCEEHYRNIDKICKEEHLEFVKKTRRKLSLPGLPIPLPVDTTYLDNKFFN